MNPPTFTDVDSQPEPEGPDNSGNGYRRSIEGRLSALETRIENLATKEDVQKIKDWVLAGVVAGMIIAVAVAVAVALAFL